MNSWKPIFSSALMITLITACSTSPKKTSSPAESTAPTPAATNAPLVSTRPTALSREMAHSRSKQVSHVSYTMWFGLDEAHDDYEGRMVINFELRAQARELTKTLGLDFEDGTIRSLTLNGQALDTQSIAQLYDSHRIVFKTTDLLSGNNRVEIAFTHAYSHNGTGLHRFKDPVDQNIYLYSNFEPYDAHRMFPCVDQPDLKASYELTVEAPPEWEVISNTPERQVSKVDGRKSWQFPPSPLFSPYIFALHAGPFASWKSDANGIPIRLFARQSMKPYVDQAEWLDVTRSGLEWYGTYFGYPYPYAKYDQLIVPDFNAGAMENVGAVTFSERFIDRSKVTADRHRGRAHTILHEMAHMWFGDLVTMRWWNGLWLNESFATFVSTKALDQATSFKGAWQDFFGGKQGAYWEDQLVTTHPIEVPVLDTDQASSNFDSITYGKGAASLKQLGFLLGEEDFREGLQRYFQKFALRNTTVTDFIKTLQEAAGKDLTQWQKTWLQTAGVNTVRADWACTPEGKIAKFVLRQEAVEPGAKQLRAHRTKIALYRLKNGKFQILKQVTTAYQGPNTSIEELIGAACPALVYPNYEDYDYAKVELDPVTLKAIQGSFSKLDDPLIRQMILYNLWEMVTDGKLAPQEYASVAVGQASSEKNTQFLSRILSTLVDPNPNQDSILKYLDGDSRKKFRLEMEKLAHEGLHHAPPGSDLQLVWFRAFLEAANTPGAFEFERHLLAGQAKLAGFPVDQERRWELIDALARGGDSHTQGLIESELKIDNTDRGQKAAIHAQAAVPNTQSKQLWLDHVLKQDLPFPKLREAMRGFHFIGQEELTRKAVHPYFELVSKLGTVQDEAFVHHFVRIMYPALCNQDTIQETTDLLNSHPDLPVYVVKSLKISRQQEERCMRARQQANTAQSLKVSATGQ
ncbi:aminopeptidase N [Bdellovibrionota bacterium FG-1]